METSHHNAEFSIPVSVLHQSSCKFCTYLYLGFTGLLPECNLLHTVIIHNLHLLAGRYQSPSKFSVPSHMFSDVEFCEVDIVAGFPPQLPYHFHCRNHIQNAWWHILHFDYNCTATQHSHTRLDSVQEGTIS
jgi:hypothetical protein